MLNGQEKKVLLLLLVCMVIGSGIWFWRQGQKQEQEAAEIILEETQETQGQNQTSSAKIFVHLTGAVKNPGVYEVPAGTRLFQVIELAGGTTEAAEVEAVNLAQLVEDGKQIHIPAQGEVQIEYNHVSAQEGGSVPGGKASGVNSGGLVNINTASAAELDTLPGVGEATAQKIIQYRSEQGPFESVEEIKNVSGIGDKKYEQMKDLLTVQ